MPYLSRPRGETNIWIDVFDKSEKVTKFDISPRPRTNLQLRVVVWEVLNVPNMDFEEVSDLYVNASMPSFDLSMNTDTHFRA